MKDSLTDAPDSSNGSPDASASPASLNENSAAFIAEASAKIAKWEKFVEEQQQKRAEAAAQLQDIMDASGLSARGIDPTAPEFAAIAHDLEFQRQLSLHYGLKLDKATPVDTSKPDVSRWRQRTNALKV